MVVLNDLSGDAELVTISAKKGMPSVFENESSYVRKAQDQIDAMGVEECIKQEQLLIVRTSLIRTFKDIDLKEKEYIKYLAIAAVVAMLSLPLKTHKPNDNYSGRPVANHIDDPT